MSTTEYDGCVSNDNQVMACYLHGLFDNPASANGIIKWAGLRGARNIDLDGLFRGSPDRVADVFEQHLDLKKLLPDSIAARIN